MECLQINLGSLPRQYFHFRGTGSSIKASESLRLFYWCCGLRSSHSLRSRRYVLSAKTLKRAPSAGGNGVIVQHPQRAIGDRWRGCVPRLLQSATPYRQALRAASHSTSASVQMSNWLSLRFRDASVGIISLALIVLRLRFWVCRKTCQELFRYTSTLLSVAVSSIEPTTSYPRCSMRIPGGQLLLRLAERDPLPHWNKPTLRDDSAQTKVTVAKTRLAR